MSVFDFAIRPQGTKPPLSHLFLVGGRLSSLLLYNTMLVLTFYLHFFRAYGMAAFGVYIFLFQINTVLDGLVSNSFGQNIELLRKAGYSDVHILAFQEFNRVSSQLIAYFLVNYVVTDDKVYTLEHFLETFNPATVGKILVNLAITEFLFRCGHCLLHTHPTLMKLHVFHHCSVNPTWNTNLLFHPVDLAIEFSGPAASLLAMHYFAWNDQAVLLYTFIIFQLWYAYDHDEDLQLFHVKHHTYCDSLYVIYSSIREDPSKNILKQYMTEKGMLSKPTKSS